MSLLDSVFWVTTCFEKMWTHLFVQLEFISTIFSRRKSISITSLYNLTPSSPSLHISSQQLIPPRRHTCSIGPHLHIFLSVIVFWQLQYNVFQRITTNESSSYKKIGQTFSFYAYFMRRRSDSTIVIKFKQSFFLQ